MALSKHCWKFHFHNMILRMRLCSCPPEHSVGNASFACVTVVADATGRSPANAMKDMLYIYSTVGRSIANIYDPRRHIYRGAKRRGKYICR